MKTIYTTIFALLIGLMGLAQGYEFGLVQLTDYSFKVVAITDFTATDTDVADIGFSITLPAGSADVINVAGITFTEVLWGATEIDATTLSGAGLGDGTKDVWVFNYTGLSTLISHTSGEQIDLVSFDVSNSPTTGNIILLANDDPLVVGAPGGSFDSFYNSNIDNSSTQDYFSGIDPTLQSYSFVPLSTEFVVNTADDTEDNNIGDGICEDVNGNCSLRAALMESAILADLNNISFNIPNAGPHTIVLAAATFNPIFDPVSIDATTQPGYSIGNPQVAIDGNGFNFGFAFLTNSLGSTVKGLAMGNFVLDAIDIVSTDNHTIEENFIGVNTDGTTIFSNGNGLSLGDSVGTVVKNNLISGNTLVGLVIDNGSQNTLVVGNRIGTNYAGTSALSNYDNIVIVESPNNTIGGPTAQDRNLISGALNTNDQGEGINIIGAASTANLIMGNYIGTDISGSFSIQNAFAGINIIAGANNNTIKANVISGNYDPNFINRNGNGIQISGVGSDNNIIQENYIGTTADGLSPLPNRSGIDIQGGPNATQIGGSSLNNEGNVISGNNNSGIEIGNPAFQNPNSSHDNIIRANYLGVGSDGTTAVPNNVGITLNTSNSNQIGGSNQINNNIISGNNNHGILLVDGSNNDILGNYIGLDANGNALGNGSRGIWIDGVASTNNTLGDANSLFRNWISGNTAYGIYLSGGTNLNAIKGNYIGTNLDANGAIANGTGIRVVESPNNTIGGVNAEEGNIVSGNTTNGIQISGASASGNTIVGNSIGTNAAGTMAIPNGRGIMLSSAANNNTIGKGNGEGNLISGNTSDGIRLDNADNNDFNANSIGLQTDGFSPLPNGADGIFMFNGSDGNEVGGLTGNEQNIIAFNRNGIYITKGPFDSSESINNSILRNSTFSNTTLGIDLAGLGITSNDADDPDLGPNNIQNFLVIAGNPTSDVAAVTIDYFVDSAPANAAYPIRVEFFIDDGNRQGKEFLFFDTFTEADYNAATDKQVTLALPAGNTLSIGQDIIATATDDNGNTSEFGASATVEESCTNPTTYYVDADGDGYGVDDPETNIVDCTDPGSGYSTVAGDNCPEIANENQADIDGDGIGDVCDDCEDADSDGVCASIDCDDNDDTIGGPTTWYADIDGDGYGDLNTSQQACEQPTGYVANADDQEINSPCPDDVNTNGVSNDSDGDGVANCNDICEGFDDTIDSDGDGIPDDCDDCEDADSDGVCASIDCDDNDDTVGGPTTWYADIDGDGYGDLNTSQQACEQPTGYVANADDQELNSPCPDDVNTNGVSNDSDGDGVANCNDICEGFDDTIDSDGDGIPDGCDDCEDADSDGVCASIDCDDNDDTIGGPTTWYADIDGDGYGDLNTSQQACEQPTGYVANADDQELNSPCPDDVDTNGVSNDSDGDGVANCNDICEGFDDTIDSDGDGIPDGCDDCEDADSDGVCASIDCDDNDDTIGGPTTWYADIDGDGYGDLNTSQQACEQPTGYVANADDQEINSPCPDDVNTNGVSNDSDGDGVANCNDICEGFDDTIDSDGDGIPDDCDDCEDADSDGVCASIDCDDNDDTVGGPTTWYADIDGDGYGDLNTSQQACEQPTGYVANADDQELNSPCPDDVNTNGVSNDSDGDGVANCNDICEGFDDTIDSDGDGIPDDCDDCEDADSDGVCASIDCDDNDDTIGGPTTWYADIDGDGYGDLNTSQQACAQPTGYVANADDQEINSPCPEDVNTNGVSNDSDGDGVANCNDICEGFDDTIDSDGDGIPDGCDDCEDADSDGVCASIDCDDNDDTIGGPTTWYADIDGDGYGDLNTSQQACEQPTGYVANADDQEINSPCPDDVNTNGVSNDSDGDGVANCNDICEGFDDTIDSDGDGIPDDCDDCEDADSDGVCASIDCDDNDDTVGGPTTWYADIDGDGYGDLNTSQQACEQPTGYVANADDQELNSPCPDDVNTNGVSNDSDGDGVANCNDICEGFDDTIDSDGDGIPDGCDDCEDADSDGVCASIDCDDNDDTIGGPTTWYADIDGDGYGDLNTSQQACEQPTGYVANADDQELNSPCPDDVDTNGVSNDSDGDGVANCNDICEGFDDTIDSDGDGIPDGCDDCEDADSDGVCASIDCDDNDDTIGGPTTWYADIDGDGYGDLNTNQQACEQPTGYVANADDQELNSPCPDDVDTNGVSNDSDGDGVANCNDICEGFDDTIDSDGDGIPDGCDNCDVTLIGTPCDDGNDCTINDVYTKDCGCEGTLQDSDGDTVPDCDDICPGFDDLADVDADGIPDGCQTLLQCETAFAKNEVDATCFIEDSFNRWGWTNYFSEPGTYTLNLYSGAAQCDEDKGDLVGYVEINIDNDTLYATYNLLQGFVMTEAHLYVGCEPYPIKKHKPTVSPGHYTYVQEGLNNLTSYQIGPIDIADLNNEIHVIAHAEVCESNCFDCVDEESYSPSKNKVKCNNNRLMNIPDLDIFPNPVKQSLNIEIKNIAITNAKVSVYNKLGQLVYRDLKVDQNNIAIEISNHITEVGVYFIFVEQDGVRFHKRFVFIND